MKTNSCVIYTGASLLDGKPIMVIVSGLKNASANVKTGDLLQTYILRADIDPIKAIKTREDISICGNCTHRGEANGKLRTCYVNVGQGALSVYRAWERGAIPDESHNLDKIVSFGFNRIVRLGTYGDPAAVPLRVWETLTKQSIAHTGYTHQWRNNPQLKAYCMASVDSASEAILAQVLGWRTFRVNSSLTPTKKLDDEISCPASAESGYKLKCQTCKACDGTRTNRKSSIVINAHGGFAVMHAIKTRALAKSVTV